MQQASPRAHSRATWPRTLEPTCGARDQAKESTVKLTPWLGNGLHGLGRGSMALAVERGVRGQRQTRDRFECLTTIEISPCICASSQQLCRHTNKMHYRDVELIYDARATPSCTVRHTPCVAQTNSPMASRDIPMGHIIVHSLILALRTVHYRGLEVSEVCR